MKNSFSNAFIKKKKTLHAIFIKVFWTDSFKGEMYKLKKQAQCNLSVKEEFVECVYIYLYIVITHVICYLTLPM